MAGIYIHVPFCSSKCFYCDFYSGPARSEDLKGQFAEAIVSEMRRRANELTDPVTTVYIGGGTPSQLSPRELDRIIAALPLADVTEFTIEVNPEDVDAGFATWLATSPVDRVSMGIQSFIPSELDAIGRRHTPGRALEAVRLIRDAGIRNLSLDLMYGLPGQTAESFARSVDMTLDLAPEHISAYALMLEPGTRLSAMIASGKLSEIPQEESDSMYRRLCDTLRRAGYDHYEISNFALPGRRSAHNSAYWNLTPYLGLGPAAHSYTGGLRRFNAPSVKRYLADSAASLTVESISESEAIDEYIMIRLRTSDGLDVADFRRRFGDDATARLQRKITAAACRLTSAAENRVRIPEDLWLVSDPIIVDLMTD